MLRANEFNPLSQVRYRPIEAAIRWSGLARHERHILEFLKGRRTPEPDDFPKWPALRLNTERIYDAIVNRELPYGIEGIAVQDQSCVDHPDLTVRHVDLKTWMTKYYPGQMPGFLFSEIERTSHPTITIDAVQTLIFERDTIRSLLDERDREIQTLRQHQGASLKAKDPQTPANQSDRMLGIRGETTYLNIVGGLLKLLLGHAPSGQPYSSFRTQESVISALVAHQGERLGISERTLAAKFAAAKRELAK